MSIVRVAGVILICLFGVVGVTSGFTFGVVRVIIDRLFKRSQYEISRINT